MIRFVIPAHELSEHEQLQRGLKRALPGFELLKSRPIEHICNHEVFAANSGRTSFQKWSSFFTKELSPAFQPESY
jgi:hypothetical protein